MRIFLLRLLKEPGEVLLRLFQCFFVWGRPAPRGNPKEAQLIVVQAMSDCEGDVSSQTNLCVAGYVKGYYERFGTPIFPQAEVGRILERQGIPTVGRTAFYSTVDLRSHDYVGSDGIARLQKRLCDERGWTRVLVVASYPHAHRACWIYERLGLEVIVPPALPKMRFEREFSQRRWRRPISAYSYELLARLFFLYKGLI